ncbi:hypothetical protein Tco_0786979, partial [Tanacetum coccineum]
MYPPVAGVASLTETQFDLRPHMESPNWTEINAGNPARSTCKKAATIPTRAAFKSQHWVIDPTTEDLQCGEDQAGTGIAQLLRSTRRSLTPSSWHTLLTGNSQMRNGHGVKLRGLFPRRFGRFCLATAHSRPSTPGLLPLNASSQPTQNFEIGVVPAVSGGCGDDEESADDQEDEDEDGDGDSSRSSSSYGTGGVCGSSES